MNMSSLGTYSALQSAASQTSLASQTLDPCTRLSNSKTREHESCSAVLIMARDSGSAAFALSARGISAEGRRCCHEHVRRVAIRRIASAPRDATLDLHHQPRDDLNSDAVRAWPLLLSWPACRLAVHTHETPVGASAEPARLRAARQCRVLETLDAAAAIRDRPHAAWPRTFSRLWLRRPPNKLVCRPLGSACSRDLVAAAA